MSGDWLGLVMFVVAFGFIASGYPVAFVLGGTALIFSGVGVATGYFEWSYLQLFPERIFGIMSNYVLLAVPFFILMGTLLERSRLAEDLLETMGALFGGMRGGLALSVVAVGSLLAAATGVVGASVVSMGLISLPVMLAHGYSARLSSGVIAATGTLGQIIPPSIVLVVLGDQLGVSVGDLFVGALVPGLLLAALYAGWIGVVAAVRPAAAPAIAAEHRPASLGPLLRRVALVLVPPIALIVVVLGSIFAGIATPTEAGALGAVGALVLAALRRRLGRGVLRQAARETTQLTTMVVFLLVGSTLFSLVFRGLMGDAWVEDLLTSLPGGRIGLLIVANLVIFVLGFFIDFFEIAFIILPLIVPAAQALDVDLVWFGVMIAINLQTSFLTPPFGFSLFYLRGVAPESVTTLDIYRGALPFIVIQLIALVAIVAFPGLVLSPPGP